MAPALSVQRLVLAVLLKNEFEHLAVVACKMDVDAIAQVLFIGEFRQPHCVVFQFCRNTAVFKIR